MYYTEKERKKENTHTNTELNTEIISTFKRAVLSENEEHKSGINSQQRNTHQYGFELQK